MARTQNLPELFGTKQTAAEYGVRVSNLGKILDLPEPDYAPDHPNPKRRVEGGRLWVADRIREHAKVFKARQRPRPESARAA